MRGRLLLSVCLAALALAVASASASADVFGTISLLSASPFEQADYAHDAAVSGNGQYVVFDGSFGGVTGVWRRETRPGGRVEQVAGGDAELPSISANGQYVSFTTREGDHLAGVTDGLPVSELEFYEAPAVYVRNMQDAPTQAGAFELASAVSGSTQELTYSYPGGGTPAEVERYGSVAAGRTALSADGRKVVFVTTAASDLNQDAQEVQAEGPKAETPPMEVAVRDLETNITEVVSVEYDPASGKPVIDPKTGRPEPVAAEPEGASAYGAVYSTGGPPPFAAPVPYHLTAETGASISADGSTVAWLGQDIGEQVPLLAGETVLPRYSEPLWRRISDGPQSPTRRVTGGSDPENPACAASGEQRLPSPASAADPCQGPFAASPSLGVWTGGEGNLVPRLSGDGYEVAFLANAPLVSQGSDFGSDVENRNGDLYLANMHEGLTREQALRQLTELASGNESSVADNSPILDLAISTDGSQVAFTTRRIVFPLGSPTYVSEPASLPGMAELFEVDLQDDTLTLVTHGYEGGPSEHPHKEANAGDQDQYLEREDGALAPSFSSDGELLAFSSTASNLVYGDGNTPPLGYTRVDGADVFLAPRIVFGAAPTPEVISPAPANPSPSPSWSMWVTQSSAPNSHVRLDVEVPGGGVLKAAAIASIKVTAPAPSRGAKRSAHRAVNSHSRPTVTTRTVASGSESPGAGGLVTLELSPASPYAPLARAAGGLPATVEVTFIAPGRPTLHENIEITFKSASSAQTAKRARAAAEARRRRARAAAEARRRRAEMLR